MFGLSPRNSKVAPPPTQPRTTPNNTLDRASDDVQRLMRELEEVLSKPLSEHLGAAAPDSNTPQAATAKTTFSGGVSENQDAVAGNEQHDTKDHAFQWMSKKPSEDESEIFKADKRSQVWLKRAQRQHRLAQARKVSLCLLLALAVGAFLILTIWPPGSA